MLHTLFTLDYEIHGNGEGCSYQLMVEQVSDRILGEPSWVVPIEDSFRVAQLIDQIKAK